MEEYDYSVELTEIDESYIHNDLAPEVAKVLAESNEDEKPGTHRVLKTIALFALAILLLINALMGSVILNRLVAKITEQEARIKQLEEKPTTVVQHIDAKEGVVVMPSVQMADELKTNTGDKDLTPADIYSNYVDSVVAIQNYVEQNTETGEENTLAATGSGFVLTENGYIVTNYHVIEDADAITVVFTSGVVLDAKIVGADSIYDLALLKVEADGLKAVSVGDSEALQVGESVCAIGNPFGSLTNTLTTGVISAVNREFNSDGVSRYMLQTDCAINEGNSGGPLFDMNGNVIGITTAKYYGMTVEGIGFAIPIKTLMDHLTEFMDFGYVRNRPLLGITLSNDVDGSNEVIAGPVIREIEQGSCVDLAGLQVGDRILSFEGIEVFNATELKEQLSLYQAGDTVTILAERNGEQMEFSVVLDEKIPEEAALRNVDD